MWAPVLNNLVSLGGLAAFIAIFGADPTGARGVTDWGADQIAAREVYRALYDVLQGIQRQVVSISGTDYIIWSAIEEVTGQDLQDPDIPGYFRVLAFFSMQIKAI